MESPKSPTKTPEAATATDSLASAGTDYNTSNRRQAGERLEFCEDFGRIADRWERWWRCENDTALVYRQSSRHDNPPGVPRGKLFDLLEDPERWIPGREAQLANTVLHGDALPAIRVDLGPVTIAAFLGAPLQFAHDQDTSWHEPIIEDWDDLPPLELRADNRWWQATRRMTRELARRAAGRYLVCLPDLSGPSDILANLRGSERLCLDLFEEREKIAAISDHLADIWHRVHEELWGIIHAEGAAGIHWLGCWSERPYTVPTCDFNALIGPTDFQEICLPAYRKQARLAGRVCFHLDGPDAARHAEALAKTPELSAIQYTPGAGTPSAVAKLEMLRMLQDAGKPVLVITPQKEVEELTRLLDPKGLAIWAE